MNCLVDYGIATSKAGILRKVLFVGAAATVVQQGNAVVTGFTAYRNFGATTEPCPPAIVR